MPRLKFPRQDGRFDPPDAHVVPITPGASPAEVAAAVADGIAAHEAAADPHGQYTANDPALRP